jgi:hypothetical protein
MLPAALKPLSATVSIRRAGMQVMLQQLGLAIGTAASGAGNGAKHCYLYGHMLHLPCIDSLSSTV